MPQVSLYVDDALMEELRVGAANEGVSLSKHVAHRLQHSGSGTQSRCATPSGLPEGYFSQLYGCIDDDSFARPEQPDAALDAPRLSFDGR